MVAFDSADHTIGAYEVDQARSPLRPGSIEELLRGTRWAEAGRGGVLGHLLLPRALAAAPVIAGQSSARRSLRISSREEGQSRSRIMGGPVRPVRLLVMHRELSSRMTTLAPRSGPWPGALTPIDLYGSPVDPSPPCGVPGSYELAKGDAAPR